MENILKILKVEEETLNLIVKADALGSKEAIVNSLSEMKVDVQILLAGVGGISKTDVGLASNEALIIGFNVDLICKQKKWLNSIIST